MDDVCLLTAMSPTPEKSSLPDRRHHRTSPEDVIPWRQRLGIGLGKMVEEATQNSIHVLSAPILNMMLGMSPAARTMSRV